jgi:hypothetical protein
MHVYSRSIVCLATVAAIYLAQFLLPMPDACRMLTMGLITVLWYWIKSSLVASTATKDNLGNINNNNDNKKLQNNKDKDEIVQMLDALTGIMV